MTAYRDRQVSLATKHCKERAVALPFYRTLGLSVVVPSGLDTDALGTFSGEVERQGSALETCVRKARLGMAATGLPFGVANEGSFGPHPFIPFIPAGIEIMTFVDDERGFVITESLLAEKTNYGHRECRIVNDISDWLSKVGFPSHALIVRPNCLGRAGAVEKGIVSLEQLTTAINGAASRSSDGIAWVEPGMRAHLNPTRMLSIRKLANRLARRLATPCPSCRGPGWGQTDTVKGLPCEVCAAPTIMVRFQLFSCVSCAHREERPRSDGLHKATPQYCPECNP